MKRILIYIGILTAVLLIPLERADVGKLRPVQTVSIYREGDSYTIATDTGDKGSGKSALEALNDLKKTTPAVIYLDTAQFLLVGKNVEKAVEQLRHCFHDSVELYSFRGEADLAAVSKYLEIHGKGPKLKQWNLWKKLPILWCFDEQIKTAKKY